MFFALRALCPCLRFTVKGKNFFVCAARLVPAPKVHRGSKQTIYSALHGFVFSLCSGLCLRLRFTGKARKVSFRYALESRKLRVSLGVNKVKNIPSLCATECNN